MATVALSTTPTQIDDGTSYTVLVTNAGAVTVDLSRGGRLRPGQTQTVYPEGVALTAAATSGTGSVTTSTTAKPLPNPSDPAVLAASSAFTGTYAPWPTARPGNNVVFWGDSLTRWGDSPAVWQRGTSWPVYASILSGQRINYMWNAGVTGDRTDQMIARFTADVAAYSPNAVTILAGTNDTGQSVALATIQANIRTMVGLVRSIGAVPVLCTIPPNSSGTPADRKARITALNLWIRRYAAAQGLPLVDFYALLVDPANGNYLSAYNNDGTHPNSAGFAAMASLANSVIAPLLPPRLAPLPLDANDPSNLVAGGLFLADSNSDGLADSWLQITATGATPSIVTGDTTISGNWQKVVATATSGTYTVYQQPAATPVVGHTYALVGRVQSSGISGTGKIQAFVRFRNGGGTGLLDASAVYQLDQPISGGVFYIEATAPANSASMLVQLQALAGTETVQWAQIGLYDLTALGV